MFEWLTRMFHRPSHQPEGEVEQSKAEQRRRFDAWTAALSEVRRVERLAEQRHGAMHRHSDRHRR